MPEAGRSGNAAFHAVVLGRVQGVGFRYSAVRQARALGIAARWPTCPTGASRCGPKATRIRLDRFLAWLRRGPPGAHVRDVQVDWLSLERPVPAASTSISACTAPRRSSCAAR